MYATLTPARTTRTCSHSVTYNAIELHMSTCAYGCKVYACQCGTSTAVVHSATYGCRSATPVEYTRSLFDAAPAR